MGDLRALIDKMLSSPLTNLQEILPSRIGWSDAVGALGSDVNPSRYRLPGTRARADYIRRKLGHMISTRENAEALCETYVTVDETPVDLSTVGKEYVNRTQDSIKEFVEDLCQRARDAKGLVERTGVDSSERARQAARSFHVVLHAERGAGKTFLLNHILARFNDDFDAKRILWVRIDLVESFGGETETDFKLNLRHRIYAQVTKIVLRYYQPGSDYYGKGKPHPLNAVEDLYVFVRENAPSDDIRGRWEDQVQTMIGAFCRIGEDSPLHPDMAPEHLAQRVVEFVRKQGYSIICVLDGLDRLESSAYQVRRFERLFDAAARLHSSLGSLGMMLVSVTRTNTLNTLPDISMRPNHYISGDTQFRKVFAVDISAILNKRIKYIQQSVTKLAKEEGWPLDDWPDHIRRFGEYLQSSEEDQEKGVFLAAFGLNRRAQVQIIQLRYHDFLDQEETRAYAFAESLVLSGHRYPPKPYRYRLTETGARRKEFIRNEQFDHNFLSSIYWFPYVDPGQHSSQTLPVPHCDGVVWGIRLLQLISAAERLAAKELVVDRPTVKEASDILYELFGYPRNDTVDLVDTFIEFEFLGARGDDFPVYREPRRLQLFLMPKAFYCLRNFVYDVAYQSLCAMRIPLVAAALGSSIPFFVAASLDTVRKARPNWDLRVSQSLVQWIAAKITNSCGLYRLLQSVNKVQQERFNSRYYDVSRHSPRWARILDEAANGGDGVDGMFKFCEKMPARIRTQVDRIINSIMREDPRALDEIEQLVASYWTCWGGRA